MDVDGDVEHKRARDSAANGDSDSTEEQGQQEQVIAGMGLFCMYGYQLAPRCSTLFTPADIIHWRMLAVDHRN